jgi:RNA polymerase sigma factor (sigma-70 family)
MSIGGVPPPGEAHMDPQQLLIKHWRIVESLIATTARKRKLQDAETEELASVVKVKLFENDCAVIKNFRGESKLSTYLHVLIDRAALDICVKCVGKWHSSAAAKRLGPAAIELERLMYRSGLALDDAMAAVRRAYPQMEVSELNALFAQIPKRKLRDGRSVSIETVEDSLCDDEEADALIIAEERRQTTERAATIIRRHLSGLGHVDRLVFQFRFEANLRMADIARMLGIDAGRLYRRHQELLRELRDAMESDNITAREAADLIGHLSEESDFGLRKTELRPSESSR